VVGLAVEGEGEDLRNEVVVEVVVVEEEEEGGEGEGADLHLILQRWFFR
jgi:hypothetical protein